MVVECICISVILLIIFVGFLRSKYRSYAFALLPLLALPVIHLVGMLFVFGLGFCPEEYRVVALSIVDLVGLVIGCVCCALLSSFIVSFASLKSKVNFESNKLCILTALFY